MVTIIMFFTNNNFESKNLIDECKQKRFLNKIKCKVITNVYYLILNTILSNFYDNNESFLLFRLTTIINYLLTCFSPFIFMLINNQNHDFLIVVLKTLKKYLYKKVSESNEIKEHLEP